MVAPYESLDESPPFSRLAKGLESPMTGRIAMTALALGLALFGTTDAAAVVASEEIGVTAAVNPNATGTPPAETPRTLDVGIRVVRDEQVITTTGGQAQLLFLDGSTLTVGPNSALVLDEFVYDAEAKTGKIVMSATKGVLRFVGGRISKHNPVEIRTPSATIGIRGGIALITIAASGATNATLLFGERMTVVSDGITKSVNRPGYRITATPNRPPSDPAPSPAGEILVALDNLESRSEPIANDRVVVADTDVAASGVAEVGSATAPQTIVAHGNAPMAKKRRAARQFRRVIANAATDNQVDASLAEIALALGITDPNSLADAAQDSVAQLSGLAQLLAEGTPLTGVSGRALFTAPGVLGAAGPGLAISTLARVGDSLGGSAGGEPFLLRSLTGSFPVGPGNEPNLTPFGPTVGTGFRDPDGDFFFYNLATIVADPARNLVLFAGRPTNPLPTGFIDYELSGNLLIGGAAPFFLDGPLTDTLLQEHGASIAWTVGDPIEGSRAFGALVLQIVGAGPGQTSLIGGMIGSVDLDASGRPFLRGGFVGTQLGDTNVLPLVTTAPVASVDSASGHDFFGADADFFLLQAVRVNGNDVAQDAGASQIAAGGAAPVEFFPTVLAKPDTGGFGGIDSRTQAELRGFATGLSLTLNPAGLPANGTVADSLLVYVSSEGAPDPTNVQIDTFPARNEINAQLRLELSGPGTRQIVANLGDPLGSNGHSIFIEDDGFGAGTATAPSTIAGVNVAADLFLISLDVIDAGPDFLDGLPPDQAFCFCTEARWGAWSGQIAGPGGERDVVHFGWWTAGQFTEAAALAGLTGVATYDGHAIGTVFDGANLFVERGDFQLVWDFGLDTGTATIQNFDGRNFVFGDLAAATGAENLFAGTLTGGPAGFSGRMAGAFYGPVFTDGAAEVGTQFNVAGPGDYRAVGIGVGRLDTLPPPAPLGP